MKKIPAPDLASSIRFSTRLGLAYQKRKNIYSIYALGRGTESQNHQAALSVNVRQRSLISRC